MRDVELISRVERAIAKNQHQGWLYSEDAVSMCDTEKIKEMRAFLRKAAVAAILEVYASSQPHKGD